MGNQFSIVFLLELCFYLLIKRNSRRDLEYFLKKYDKFYILASALKLEDKFVETMSFWFIGFELLVFPANGNIHMIIINYRIIVQEQLDS